MNQILFGKVEKGKLVLDYPEKFIVRLASLEGKRVEVIIRKETNTRTSNQNRYYFGIVLAVLSEHTGYEVEQMHDALKEKFASKRLDNGLMITERTSKMSTVRFTEYIDQIKRWASIEMGCYIPDAGEIEI
jgi:predicted SPOUT superfamily RNA methylase MTH1